MLNHENGTFLHLLCNAVNTNLCQKCAALSWKRKCIIVLLIGVTCQVIYHIRVKHVRYKYKVDTYSLPCEMPILDPFDHDQVKNLKISEDFKCDRTPNPVYIDDYNILQVNTTALEMLKVENGSIICTCQTFEREPASDDKILYSDNFICNPPYNIQTDFFKISCASANRELVDTILTKIDRSDKIYKSTADDNYSVLLFGLDSMSRNNAIRQIPKAVKYLQEDLSSIDLLMYNRIGGHTFDNIIPMLTGLFANTDDIPYLSNIGSRFERFPLIWKNFSDNHYATFYAEDNIQYHTFNFQKEGFKTQPTDHYMRPFWIADYELRPTNLFFWKENMSSYSKRRCLANIPKYLVQMNYFKQFINTYKDVRKFGMSHINDITHQNVNDLHLAEDNLVEFFHWLKTGGHLNNTFLIVYSDHGPRGQSHTHQSILETNLPFLSIVPPDNFRKSYPNLIANMRRNIRVLTTHFDLFATLRDILNRQFKEPSVVYVRNKARGISLFRDIRIQRSCAEANIPEQFCMCYRSQQLNVTNNTLLQDIAESVIDKLNRIVSHEKKCAHLHLKTIIEARVLVQGKRIEHEQQWPFNKLTDVVEEDDYTDYKVIVQTVPGNGKFYATSKSNSDGSRYVLENIDRVNRYNNQSNCVSDEKLRPLCYCLEQ